jgi:iron-sulfur cluster assembly accessory protein
MRLKIHSILRSAARQMQSAPRLLPITTPASDLPARLHLSRTTKNCIAPIFPTQQFRNFSAQAVQEPRGSSKQRRVLSDPIVVTPRASERLAQLLSGPSASGAIGIRLGVKRRGCNGLSYTLNYATEKAEKDLEMQAHGITVFIEPMALFSVVGTVMDWEETELKSEFTFNNPNSKGACGCGESFNV